MPSDSNLSTQERAVKTTILTINLDDINWAQLKQYCHLVRYELPYQEQGKWAYLHNWYKETCNYPYLLQAPRNIRPSVYVKYPSEKEVLHLEYENNPLPRSPVDIEDLHVLHALVKTLLSDYFYQRDVFVSNADFFLPVSPTDRDFITALKIRINENWRHNRHNPASYEFFVADEGKQLRKLQQSELDSRNLWGGSYYALDYIDKMAVLRRLKPSQILKAANRRSAIYTEPFIKRTRATITYHSVRNLDALQQSRSYVLNQFLNGVLVHFAQIGLPFQLKELRMRQIRALSSTEMKKSQISIGNQTIYIVDDRIRPKIRPELEPDDFANQLLTSIQDLFSQENGSMPDSSSNMTEPTFAIGNAAELSEGDYVLRIQDNEENDFEDKTRVNPKTGEEIIVRSAILKGNDDPLPEFYAAYPHLVKQSLNVNDNTRLRQDEKRKPKKQGKPQAWSVDSYLDYDLPKFDSNFQTKLEVCLNQLFLKDIVMYPQDIGVRLPEEQTRIIANKVFMFAESLMYFDGSNLHFIPVVNNYGQASKLIRDVTGKDLIRDVLKPAMERAKFEFAEDDLTDEDETQKILRNGRFIISQDYVWQIEDNQGRILYPDEELEYRLENLEQRRHISEFYPEFPVTGDEPFTEAQLRDYKRFLQE
ncbi:hypothetical protein L0244_39570, partial [bacterium]|nr:hypothetical protein [bacterium]